jgi:ubiquinone/menaquinone biosynthesis C-methylase UbiE
MSGHTVARGNALTYSDAVAMLRERNRPSGGIRTVHTVARDCFVSPTTHVLEIGSTTGFTAVNLSLLTSCRVTGVDINLAAVQEARRYAVEMGVQSRTLFLQGSATALPFLAEYYDLVWASNVSSFIADKNRALGEYVRVLRVGGYLVAIPIYYRHTPPPELLAEVADAIGQPIRILTKSGWLAHFQQLTHTRWPLELISDEDFEYIDESDRIDAFCDLQLRKQHLSTLAESSRAHLATAYRAYLSLFNRNLRYCGFSILVFQRRCCQDEVELFRVAKSAQNH